MMNGAYINSPISRAIEREHSREMSDYPEYYTSDRPENHYG